MWYILSAYPISLMLFCYWLQTTDDPPTRYLFDKKIKTNSSKTWVPLLDGLNSVQKGGYAFYSEGNTPYKFIAKRFGPGEICDLNEIVLRTETLLGVTLRKHSPFMEMFRIR